MEDYYLLPVLLGIFALLYQCQGQQYRCSYDQQRQCQNSVNEAIQKRPHDISSSDVGRHCRNLRDQYNCLLWQTSGCLRDDERRRNGDLLKRANEYVRDTCSQQGDWRNSRCFQSEQIVWCQNMLPITYSTGGSDTCWKYNSFHTCITDVLRLRCSQDDALYLGNYLVDNAGESAWRCGIGDNIGGTIAVGGSGQSGDRDRDRDRDYDRNRDRDRDRDRTWGRDRDRDRDWDSRDKDRDRFSPSDRDGDLCCRKESCSSGRMEECRSEVSRVMQTNLQTFDNTRPCRQARNAFNCLLWHTSECGSRSDRERNNDLITQARTYISRSCDKFGRYNDRSCYRDSDMQRCERNLPVNRNPNSDTCRAYLSLKDCVMNQLRLRCQLDDDLFLGAYLMDRGEVLAIQCSKDFNDPYFPGNYPQTGFQRDYYTTPYADDDDASCAQRTRSTTDRCSDKWRDEKRQLHSEPDRDLSQKKSCCASRNFKRCVTDAVRSTCGSGRENVINSMVGQAEYELKDLCRDYPDSVCGKAVRHAAGSVLLSLVVTVFSVFIARNL